MRRGFYFVAIVSAVSGALLLNGIWFQLADAAAKEGKKMGPSLAAPAKPQVPVKITIVPVGPTQAELDLAMAAVKQLPAVKGYLDGNSYRLLSFQVSQPEKLTGRPSAPISYEATFYDYSHERTIVARGPFNNISVDQVIESNFQPIASDEEFNEAVRILMLDDHFGPPLKNRTLKPFRPMPPVVQVPDGQTRVERTINVGLSSGGSGAQNEIVGVRLAKSEIQRYPGGAPPTSLATPEACGIPNSGQATTPRNTAGQYQLTVTQGPNTLWEMLIVRPSVSSGTRASGIEVQNVKFKGKTVLKRGHAPVLNVKYGANECGPYRDWQYQEGMFFTPAGSTDPAPGIRICPTAASTALENGTDMGDFRGVAVYTNLNGTPADTSDDETVLLTELEAGWYRYIMEWRFGNNGIIRPRFGFGATDDSCVCFVHTHHVYWRFDFDVVSPNNRVYLMEKGKKFLNPLVAEQKVSRNYGTTRSLLVQNGAGDEGYLIVPNSFDGPPQAADPFGKGDFWLLRYKNVVGGTALQNEFDDGFNQTTSANSFIQIDSFVNGESVDNQDVVIWYGGTFIHADAGNIINPNRGGSVEVLAGDHVVGPDPAAA